MSKELDNDKQAYINATESMDYGTGVTIGCYVGRLEEQNKRFREALEFYADMIHYINYEGNSTVSLDYGVKARIALEEE